jgi:aspartate kinase
VGIVTESTHGRARILEVRTERLQRHLDNGLVVVVAGFQGTSSGHAGTPEITTLGRGGSDTSAVALAAALGAEACEIYTDVPGGAHHRPPQGGRCPADDNDQLQRNAGTGQPRGRRTAPRAVEIARNYGVPLVVRSSWSDAPGTLLTSDSPSRRPGHTGLELTRPVDGAELEERQAVLALSHVPDQPGWRPACSRPSPAQV